jgi:hypothetical protein
MTAEAAPAPVPRLWREEPSRLPEKARPPSRRRRAYVLLAVMLLLGGVVAGLLFWLNPVEQPRLVPLWVTDYQARGLLSLPPTAGDRDALRLGDYFAHEGQAFVAQGRAGLVQELQGLRGRKARETVVVYLSGYALSAARGQVFVLPADADPIRPSSWLALRQALQWLRACPARHKLLILDVMWPWADARLGVPADDVAGRVQADLQAVADPDRLVLCACSPGQVALASEDMGRSVFGYYLEEGLRGWAEVARPGGTHNGRVSVKALAEFVRGRVDRWARRNRNTRQTPVLLGSARDFPLVVLEHGEPEPHLALPARRTYPDGLRKAWLLHDRWSAEEVYRIAPRTFGQLQATLLAAEKAWRSGQDAGRVQRDWLSGLERLQEKLAEARTSALPRPRSLALAVQGRQPEEKLAEALKELLQKINELNPTPTLPLASGATTPPPAKNPAQEAARAQLVAGFQAKFKGTSDLDLAWAVFLQAAADPHPHPETLRLLDELLRPREPQPRHVETLFLRRLAELAGQWTGDWPFEVVHRALEVVHKGELAASRAETFPWVAAALEEAARKRHGGEVLFWARGYARLDEADELLKKAAADYDAILVQENTIEEAQRSLATALAFLPAYLPYLERYPAAEAAWLAAVRTAGELALALEVPPIGFRLSAADLRRKGDDFRLATETLRQSLEELRRPFGSMNLARVIRLSKRENAGAAVYQEMDDLLTTPFLKAADRVALWRAARDLGRRLHEETLAADREEGQPRPAALAIPAYEPERPQFEQRQRQRAVLRARASIALLQLANLSPARSRELQDNLARVSRPRSDPAAWYPLSQGLRRAWSEVLPARLQTVADPAARDLLGRLIPAFSSAVAPEVDADQSTKELRTRAARELLAWLAGRYRHEERGLAGGPLHAAAAGDYQQFVGVVPEAQLQIGGDTEVRNLTAANPVATSTLELRLTVPDRAPVVVSVGVLTADDDWLHVTPDLSELPRLKAKAAEGEVRSCRLPLRIELLPGALRSPAPRPLGFLVWVEVNGRTAYHRVSIPLLPAPRPEVFLSATTAEPVTPLGQVRLRPVKARQPLHLFVRNPTKKAYSLKVELAAGGAVVAGAQKDVTLNPGDTQRVTFTGPVIPATAALPELRGALTLRLLDRADKNKLLVETPLVVDVASAREYVRVSGIQFDPASPRNGDRNRLEVRLRAAGRLTGPPCLAELVLPDERIPGLLGVGDGTLRGEVPARPDPAKEAKELKLHAEQLRFEAGTAQQGYAYLTIDGNERAFVFHTTFARRGDPTTPRQDHRPAVRLRVASFAQANSRLAVPVEVDNAPAGATLEVSLGRSDGEEFISETVQKRPRGREYRIGFSPFSADGALLFEAAVQDWVIPFDASKVRGARVLQARLLDRDGRPIVSDTRRVTLDDQAPAQVAFVDMPAKARRDQPLTVKATGLDTVSGVSKVNFFLGQPVDNKVPPKVALVPGQAVDSSKLTWAAQLPLPPDLKGPTDVSVQFVNRVGLSTFATTSVELVDFDPAKVNFGRIEGTVVEGPLPQAGLDVVLKDDKGKEVAKTKTKEGGSFAFAKVPPGKYTVSTAKVATKRKGQVPVTVEAGKTATVQIKLYL